MKYCDKCSKTVSAVSNFCPQCGGDVIGKNDMPAVDVVPKSRFIAGLLALVLGSFGMHWLYLGYPAKARTRIILLICIIGFIINPIWALVDLFLILNGSIDTDVNGIPLKD